MAERENRIMGVESINAKFFDINGAAEEIAKTLQKYARLAEEDLEKTTATWDHDIKFEKKVTQRTKKIEIDIFTWSDIYRFVNDGTSVRFATMSKDFVPKTKPGVLRSSAGQGGVQYVSKQNPRPGIKARNFTKTIAAKYEKQFADDVQSATAKGAKLRVLKVINTINQALAKIKRAI